MLLEYGLQVYILAWSRASRDWFLDFIDFFILTGRSSRGAWLKVAG